VRHVYIGLSKRVWCGEKLQRKRDGSLADPVNAPLTEGEYIDGFFREGVCPGCVEAITPVRGRPVEIGGD
jgi:hypothetical protein